MERGLLAPLSPKEEMALLRISLGSADVEDVHVQRLVKLGLVHREPSGLQLTEHGKKRLDGFQR